MTGLTGFDVASRAAGMGKCARVNPESCASESGGLRFDSEQVHNDG